MNVSNSYMVAQNLAPNTSSSLDQDVNASRTVEIGPVDKFVEALQQNEEKVKDNLVSNADPQSLVQALAETELAIETAVTVRNKVVEAYQEILRMPV